MTLKPFTSPGAPIDPPPDPGPEARFAWIDIAALAVDTSYQREITGEGFGKINRIAARFNWAHFSPVVVSDRGDNHFAVVDGQHRVHAALRAGQTCVPCLIILSGAAPEAEAQAFAAINGEFTAVSAISLYRAALAANVPWATAIADWSAAAGVEVLRYQPAGKFRRPRTLTCIAFLRLQVGRDNGTTLMRLTDAIKASVRADDLALWQERFLAPMVAVLRARKGLGLRNLTAFIDSGAATTSFENALLLRGRKEFADKSPRELRRLVLDAALDRFLGVAA